MGLSDLVTPIASAHGNNRQLGQDDGASDGSCDFFGALHSKTNVAVEVSDGHESLESGSLTGPGLLLHRHDLQYLILQVGAKEEINDLKLLQKKTLPSSISTVHTYTA